MSDEVAKPKVHPRVARKEARRGAMRGGKPKPSGDTFRMLTSRKLKEDLNIQFPKAKCTAREANKMRAMAQKLEQTWQTVKANALNFQRFSPKQIEFARQYAKNGRSSKPAAMRAAGYDYGHPEDARKAAVKFLRLPYMDDLIAAFEMEEKARMKINVEDVVAWFNRIATAAMDTGDFTNANRAMENLAKYLGMFVEKKEITHKTIYSREDLDTRIAELTAILKEAEPEIERKLRIN